MSSCGGVCEQVKSSTVNNTTLAAVSTNPMQGGNNNRTEHWIVIRRISLNTQQGAASSGCRFVSSPGCVCAALWGYREKASAEASVRSKSQGFPAHSSPCFCWLSPQSLRVPKSVNKALSCLLCTAALRVTGILLTCKALRLCLA